MNRFNNLLITCLNVYKFKRYFFNSISNIRLNFSSSTKYAVDSETEFLNKNNNVSKFTDTNNRINDCSTDNDKKIDKDIFTDPTLTDEDKAKLKLYQQEYNVWKYADSSIPDHVTNEQWKVILQIDTRAGRIKYLTFIERSKRRHELDERKRERLKKEIAERRLQRIANDDGHLIYAIGHNTLFRRLEYDDVLKACYYPRLAYAMQHGPHLVLDTSFLNRMTIFQQGLTAKQLWMLFDVIKVHKQSSHMCLTGVDRNAHWYQLLKKRYFDNFPITLTEKNYTDIFPKNRLIYLSPTATDCLKTFETDKIYIMGAIVDKGPSGGEYKNATLGKAKAENIKAYRLPIDLYVKFQKGSKYLCLNHTANILLDMFVHKNWHKAFLDNIPKRKLTPFVPEVARISKARRETDKEREQFLLNMVENMDVPKSVS